jgi:hypothetical protein
MNRRPFTALKRKYGSKHRHQKTRQETMNPRVTDVLPLEGYRLLLSFSNGEKGIYDCSSLLQFEIFSGLRWYTYFNKVKVCDGAVVWPNKEDICPDTLYLESKKISELSQLTLP